MMRLLFFLLLAVFGLVAARRWTDKVGRGGGPKPPPTSRARDRSAPMAGHVNDQLATVICATCRTEYRPADTAWQCPKCQR